MASKIISVATAVPQYKYNYEEIIKYVEKWVQNQPKLYQRKVIKVFQGTEIKQKYGILPINKVFSPLSFEEKNDYYKQAAIELGSEVFSKAISKAGITPDKIDYIITISCTGYMIPSLDAYLINKFNIRNDVLRLPVTEMGCAGGAAAFIYADHFLKTNPDKTVAIITIEIPSITFQHNDFSIDNIVGSAIFADGAACAIIGATNELKPVIIDTQMYSFPYTTDILGFNLTNSGFKIILSEEIPDHIMKNFDHIIGPFLKKNNLTLNDVDNFIFHPGGKKITNVIENLLSKHDKEIDQSKNIMKNYGNMSSSTVLFILEKFLKKDINKGDYGLILGFGPGFVAQTVLLKWE